MPARRRAPRASPRRPGRRPRRRRRRAKAQTHWRNRTRRSCAGAGYRNWQRPPIDAPPAFPPLPAPRTPPAGRTAPVWPFRHPNPRLEANPIPGCTRRPNPAPSAAAPQQRATLPGPFFPIFPLFSPFFPLILYLSSAADPVRALAPALPVLVSPLRVAPRPRGGFIAVTVADGSTWLQIAPF